MTCPARRRAHTQGMDLLTKSDWIQHFAGCPVYVDPRTETVLYYHGWAHGCPMFISRGRWSYVVFEPEIMDDGSLDTTDGRWVYYEGGANKLMLPHGNPRPIPSRFMCGDRCFCYVDLAFCTRVGALIERWTHHKKLRPSKQVVAFLALNLRHKNTDDAPWLPPEMVELIFSFFRVLDFVRQ